MLSHPVTIHLCGLPEGVQLPGRTSRSRPLLGLAPGGVYRADDVTVAAGALLPHRFTLTCDQIAVKRAGPSAVSLCCTCPSGRPNLALASTLPCGVPTFLDDAARTAAITRPPHHCGIECTSLFRLGGADLCPSRPAFRDGWGTDRCEATWPASRTHSTQGPTPLIRSIETLTTTDAGESRIASGWRSSPAYFLASRSIRAGSGRSSMSARPRITR